MITHPLTQPLPLEGERSIELMDGHYLAVHGLSGLFGLSGPFGLSGSFGLSGWSGLVGLYLIAVSTHKFPLP